MLFPLCRAHFSVYPSRLDRHQVSQAMCWEHGASNGQDPHLHGAFPVRRASRPVSSLTPPDFRGPATALAQVGTQVTVCSCDSTARDCFSPNPANQQRPTPAAYRAVRPAWQGAHRTQHRPLNGLSPRAAHPEEPRSWGSRPEGHVKAPPEESSHSGAHPPFSPEDT